MPAGARQHTRGTGKYRAHVTYRAGHNAVQSSPATPGHGQADSKAPATSVAGATQSAPDGRTRSARTIWWGSLCPCLQDWRAQNLQREILGANDEPRRGDCKLVRDLGCVLCFFPGWVIEETVWQIPDLVGLQRGCCFTWSGLPRVLGRFLRASRHSLKKNPTASIIFEAVPRRKLAAVPHCRPFPQTRPPRVLNDQCIVLVCMRINLREQLCNFLSALRRAAAP